VCIEFWLLSLFSYSLFRAGSPTILSNLVALGAIATHTPPHTKIFEHSLEIFEGPLDMGTIWSGMVLVMVGGCCRAWASYVLSGVGSALYMQRLLHDFPSFARKCLCGWGGLLHPSPRSS
jgi:hypothetical protein